MMTILQQYRREVGAGVTIMTTREEHAPALEALQRLVFPNLAPQSLLRQEHYRHHITMFPEGQFVAVKDGKVVGMTTTIRYTLDPQDQHTFDEVLDGGFLNTHQPEGEWLYGMDIGTHPDYRGLGIASFLYAARQDTVVALNLKGQYTYGMLNGYGAVRDKITAVRYYEELLAGKRKDPTVSRQMNNGFKPMGLVAGYVEDPTCDGYCVLLVRENEHYRTK
ncbi:MAG: GNAT family N-acetyltransferase [Cyclobacteriaceae bacterium]|nr:GNAT family N-acetyltransferase [Cyclobacteriaceae bacterium]